MQKSNIVLIGMRGSGKSTVAKLLAEKLGFAILELDEMLVEKVGKNIPKIVEDFGWDYFRDKESEIVEDVSDFKNVIISTGGGVVTRPKNIENLRRKGVLIFLKASPKTLVDRISGDENRPALTDEDDELVEMKNIWNERKDLYKNTADFVVDVETVTVEKVAKEILDWLEK